MKKFVLILVVLISCRINKSGSFTEGYVYNERDNQSVENASVCIWKGNEKGFIEITKTDKNGYFSFKENSIMKFGNNGKDLALQFIVKKGKFQSDTLVSYPNQDTIKFNKIYLK